MMTKRWLRSFMLLCLPAVSAGTLFAQTARPPSAPPSLSSPVPPQSFQARIEEVARGFENNPRFKGLSQPQRVDRVEFVIGNTLFILLHEMGHSLIHELKLPILGREEDAADTFAVLRLLRIGSAFSEVVLTDASKGWFFSDRRDQQLGAPMLYYDEHGLNQQRAYQIVCLMYGSDPVKFKELADQSKLPDPRRESCKNDYARALSSWETVLEPHRRNEDQPKTEISVVYGEATGPFEVFAQSFRTTRFLETVANAAENQYVWPEPFTLEMQSCEGPNAGWDDERRSILICYNLPFDFMELYRAYGAAPMVGPQAKAPAPSGQRNTAVSSAKKKAR
jgi:hypothetical protein